MIFLWIRGMDALGSQVLAVRAAPNGLKIVHGLAVDASLEAIPKDLLYVHD